MGGREREQNKRSHYVDQNKNFVEKYKTKNEDEKKIYTNKDNLVSENTNKGKIICLVTVTKYNNINNSTNNNNNK